MASSKFKIGIDYHGVIDTFPEEFRKLSRAIYSWGGEVHIVTGLKRCKEIDDELFDAGIVFTHYFSIVDQLEIEGEEIEWNNGLPSADRVKWDWAKQKYCDEQGIHMMFDDSDVYKDTFDDIDTIYMHVINPKRELYGVRK